MKPWLNRWQQVHFSFPLSVLLSVSLLLVSEYSYQRSTAINHKLDAALQARIQLQTLLRLMVDAETGQRGYLLTGKPYYLRPYQEASVAVEQALVPLRLHYESADELDHSAVATTTTARADFENLVVAIRKKMRELSLTVALRSAGDESWQSILDGDAGLRQMLAIRQHVDRLGEVEATVIRDYQHTLRQTLLINRIAIAAMTVLSLLALAMYLRQSGLVANLREQQRLQLQADHDTLELQVQDRTRRLTQLMSHMQKVREDERARLARELHDELGALMVAAKLDLARLKSHLQTAQLHSANPYIQERLQHLGEALNNGISLKRRIIEDLYPSSLEKLGLVPALEILVSEFSQRSGIATQCKFDQVRLTPAAELTIYRLVQEALTNIIKYAQATQVEVCLRALELQAEIRVFDNGKGFDVEQAPVSAHGLEGMQYRVAANGGEMLVSSQPGDGTTIIARMPTTHIASE